MAMTVLRFDMRAPSFSPATPSDLYAAALDMCAFADESGFTTIGLSEHHASPDGFLPAPLVMAGLVAGRTRRIGISIGALLVPLYHPVRIAEDLAVLDLASGGRVSVIVGIGYRPEEYAAFGKSFEDRGRLFDECLETILECLREGAVQRGDESIPVTPRAATRPNPLIMVGGSTPRAARRAARFGLPFAPPIADPALFALYEDACRQRGVRSFVVSPGEPAGTFVSEDPEATWKEIGPYVLHDALTYDSWQRAGQRAYAHARGRSVAELREEGKYRVLTPEDCLALAADAAEADKTASFHLPPLVGGAPPEIGWKSLRLFVEKVMPYL
jgi:alkanesulfonate monooxygenase SsuD/methylene tetrahydromethanopterin reductase-like flavin-dependent oxidoreductase (luciferase family)